SRTGCIMRPLTALRASGATTILIAAFDAAKLAGRVALLLEDGRRVATLDEIRLPPELITDTARYLEPLNFTTNFAFFRDDGRFGTRLTGINYWHGYGACEVRWFLRLYGDDGQLLAQWQQRLLPGPGTIVIDSAEVRRRFVLPAFTGQLFIHVVGAAGHDVV